LTTTDHIRYRAGYKYQLDADYFIKTKIRPPEDIFTRYIILLSDGTLSIKSGYAWDGPSGPTIDTKTSMRGSLIHDALYQLMRMGLLPGSFRCEVDFLFKQICEDDGMSPFRRDYFYFGVKWFARFAAKKGSTKKILTAP